MGDKVPLQGSTRVVGMTPLPATLKLFHEGILVATTNGTNLTFRAKKPGPYRLEAWLDVAGEARPWIYSNPVYLEEQSLLDMRLPNTVEAPNVEVKKDIVYTEGNLEHAAKHKLDLYVPKDRRPAPVFLFLHGGAWRTGDRGLYPPLGHRFAKAGILTVIPSYRLAPKSPWPAQAEDAAAALAWTVRHIAEFGGDTNQLFLGGHSAGGHLSALLIFNRRYLEPYRLSAANIAGVIGLSGVYNLDIGDVQTSVFGKDRAVRREASPLFQVQSPAPPFLVTYCEWDYATLPAQAKIFHAALRQAGVVSELFFTPKQSHISEVIAMTHDDDATGQEVVRFIQGRKR
jgi:acetyl esterase/lipase